jgi:hypothetical protein
MWIGGRNTAPSGSELDIPQAENIRIERNRFVVSDRSGIWSQMHSTIGSDTDKWLSRIAIKNNDFIFTASTAIDYRGMHLQYVNDLEISGNRIEGFPNFGAILNQYVSLRFANNTISGCTANAAWAANDMVLFGNANTSTDTIAEASGNSFRKTSGTANRLFNIKATGSTSYPYVGNRYHAVGATITTAFETTDGKGRTGGTGWINVRDFGAQGNATTDDTAAIQAAINSASALSVNSQNYSGVVHFPPGVYLITPGTLQLKARVRLVGSLLPGQGYRENPVRFKPNGGADDSYMIGQAAGNIRNVGIVGISSFGDGSSSKTGFMNLPDVTDGIFSGLYIDNWGIEAAIVGGANCRFSWSYFQGLLNRAYIATQRGAFTLTGADNQVSHCELTGPGNATVSSGSLYCAAAVVSSYESEFDACVFQVGDVGLVITGAARGRYVGCRFDSNAGHGLLLSGGTDFTFSGCSWSRNSFSGDNTYDHINVPSGGGSRGRFTAPMFNNNSHTVRYWISDAKNSSTFFNVYNAPDGEAAATGKWTVVSSLITGVDTVSGKVAVLPSFLPVQRGPGYSLRTGVIAESFPRFGAPVTNLGTTVLTSGQQLFAAVPVVTGQVISQITFWSGTTALATGSNQWFSLYDASRNLLRVTSDDTSTAWATNAEKTLTLATSYTVTVDGFLYAGVMVNATTVPSLLGVGSTAAVSGATPWCAARDTTNTGLTNPASAPSVAQFGTTGSYCYVTFK